MVLETHSGGRTVATSVGEQAQSLCPPQLGDGAPVGTVTAGTITLDRAKPDDVAFLFTVFAGTRIEEVALTGWPPAQQEQFLRMQFEAQSRSYGLQFPNAKHWVVRCDGIAAGRMIVDRNENEREILLIDIALLPEHRHQKIGSLLMDRLMQDASQSGKSIRLHVERFNPALAWYQKLGFKTAGESEIYLEMIWQPSPRGATV